jgi:hypothetical protein
VVLAALDWGTVPVSTCGVALGLLWPTLADLDVELCCGILFYLHGRFKIDVTHATGKGSLKLVYCGKNE